METPALFLCYLLYVPPRTHRIVAVKYDENIEMFIHPGERLYSYTIFDEEFGDGMLTKLVDKFGIESTIEFVIYLLNIGIREYKKFHVVLSINPDANPIPPHEVVTDEYAERYDYLILLYDEMKVQVVILEILSIGMRMLPDELLHSLFEIKESP